MQAGGVTPLNTVRKFVSVNVQLVSTTQKIKGGKLRRHGNVMMRRAESCPIKSAQRYQAAGKEQTIDLFDGLLSMGAGRCKSIITLTIQYGPVWRRRTRRSDRK
ncbi:hypothetical protein EVAR_91454_1 [Eumeta japonica]|uniref:Uncharacterized protein n=1 Tax=Eumeta variegata TaxID=151549 RepID=A0A4C1X1H3_EUMVA|nr:hypothetical protein EVAR_91454_1 [Eumeta japonica]